MKELIKIEKQIIERLNHYGMMNIKLLNVSISRFSTDDEFTIETFFYIGKKHFIFSAGNVEHLIAKINDAMFVYNSLESAYNKD